MRLWILNIAGYLASNWRKVAIIVVAAILLVFVILGVRSCWKKPSPKLDQAEIQQLQWAQENRDLEAQRKILIESDARQAERDAAAVNATTDRVNAIAESKKRWANATEEEMAAELEARK